MDNRRSGIPGPSGGGGGGIPKRAPSPSNAAFASAGPLGSYRPASREGVEPAPGAKRFGFASASTSIPSASAAPSVKGTPSSSRLTSGSAQAKRTVSNAGLPDHGLTTPNGSANKRPFLTSSSRMSVSTTPSSARSDHHAAVETEFKRRELLAQQAYERLQQELSAKGREVDKEKEERLSLVRQWEAFSEEVKEERQALKDQRKFLQERVNELQDKNNSLSSRIDDAETEKSKAVHKEQTTTTQLSIRVAELEAQLSTAIGELDGQKEARQRAEVELQTRETEWEQEKQRMQSSQANEGVVAAESTRLTSELTGLLTTIRKLEAENLTLSHDVKQLQARKDSVEALKEQNRNLEKKTMVVDELRRRGAESEAQVRDLEVEREQWLAKLRGGRQTQAYEEVYIACADPDGTIPSIDEPAALSLAEVGPYMSRLQGALAGLGARSQTLLQRVASLRKQATEAEVTSNEEVERTNRLTHELEETKMARLKSEKARETMAMEVESYKHLLDTYQQEAQNLSAQFDSASAERITMLEGQLQTRTDELASAVQELDDVRRSLSEHTAPGGMTADERDRLERTHEAREKELLHSLDESRKAFSALEKECSSLGEANDALFVRVGRGEFDQSKLRVLEMSNNPVTADRVIRTTTLEALRKENSELLAQLTELQGRAGAQTTTQTNADAEGGMVPTQTLDNLRDEYDRLQQSMRDRDKAFDRLKEAFGAKATEYVAAVKALFGYDMHVLSRGKVKLRSVYARTSKGTSLTFDAGDEDDIANMRLIGEARQGAANVANLKRYWLGKDRCSVPCFLAALQLELYESTTQAARSGWAEGDE